MRFVRTLNTSTIALLKSCGGRGVVGQVARKGCVQKRGSVRYVSLWRVRENAWFRSTSRNETRGAKTDTSSVDER